MWNYEIGMKSDFFDNRLRLNAALFYMDWSDLQTNFQQSEINEDGEFILFAGTDNAESASSKGVELSATALLSENLIVNFNVGYLKAKLINSLPILMAPTATWMVVQCPCLPAGPYQLMRNTGTLLRKSMKGLPVWNGVTGIQQEP